MLTTFLAGGEAREGTCVQGQFNTGFDENMWPERNATLLLTLGSVFDILRKSFLKSTEI